MKILEWLTSKVLCKTVSKILNPNVIGPSLPSTILHLDLSGKSLFVLHKHF